MKLTCNCDHNVPFVISLHVKEHKNCVVVKLPKLSYYAFDQAGIVLPLVSSTLCLCVLEPSVNTLFLSWISGSQKEFEGVFLPSTLLYHSSQFGCTIHSQHEGLNVAEV